MLYPPGDRDYVHRGPVIVSSPIVTTFLGALALVESRLTRSKESP
jgi:hypothetical protein